MKAEHSWRNLRFARIYAMWARAKYPFGI
jgi:hypothetical protein